MREFRKHGSVRGALSNERPYRDPGCHRQTSVTAETVMHRSNYRCATGLRPSKST